MKRRLKHRARVGRGLLYGLLALSMTASAKADSLEGELIDKVWSGHPVSFSILAERGYLFIAYYDGERHLTLKSRMMGEKKWTQVFPEGVLLPNRNRMSNVTGWDSHNYLTMTLDRDGCLHLTGNMHNDPLIYYRTQKPLDITTLTRVDSMTGRFEDRVTYPRFLNDHEGDLVFRYRIGGSGNGNNHYNIYDPVRKVWKPLLETPLLDGQQKCSAYGTGPRKGPDGKFHMLWMWRDTPNAGSNHTLTYARSPDLVHWETSDGKPCPLPMVPGSGDIVDPQPPFRGLINMCYVLGFDANQTPVVAYHKYDEDGKSQAYVARWSKSGKWMIRQVSDWDFRWEFSKNGSQNKEVTLRFNGTNADGSLNLSYRARGKSGRWRLNAESLEELEPLPRVKVAKKPELNYPRMDYPGLQMNRESTRCDRQTWVLRWETLDRNGDKPREKVPPRSPLRLYTSDG